MNALLKFFLVLSMFFAAFLLLACTDFGGGDWSDDNWNGNGDWNGGGGQSQQDSRLTNNSGEAWISGNQGFILRRNATFASIEFSVFNNAWTVSDEGTWSTTDNDRLRINFNGRAPETWFYTVSNTQLTLDDGWGITVRSFIRTNNISTGNNNGAQTSRDTRLVNAFNEAWVSGAEGLIFRSNGTFTDIERNGNVWQIWNEGVWHTSGNNQVFLNSGGLGLEVVSYSLLGNALTLHYEGLIPWTLNRTSGVTVSGFARSGGNCEETENSQVTSMRRMREERMRIRMMQE